MNDVTPPGLRARSAGVAARAAAVVALLLGATPRVEAAGNFACPPTDGARAAADSPVFVTDRAHPGVHLEEVFVVLAGAGGEDARGGLTRLKLANDGTIVDADAAPIIDPATGSVRASVRAAWGAAPARAPLYTDLDRGALLREANALAATNAALTASRLGLAATDAAGRARLLDAVLASGPRAARRDAAEATAPAVAVIGAGAPGAVALVASGRSGLRAIDAASGAPLWTFLPLGQIAAARDGGYLRAVRLDAARAAVFGPGAKPRAFLVFSDASGHFGFDVSEPRAPRLLWRAGAAELRSVGVPSAPVAIARILIKGVAQNPAHLVAVVNGGDDADGGAARAPRRGNRIFILDLLSGAVLWRAGPAAAPDDVDAGAELKLERMNRPLAAAVRVLDTDGDGYADRWYATDTGGRVWRFDVHNGEPPATLVSGGVWASLGVADVPGAGTEARHFFQTPDAALIKDGGQLFVQVAVGSSGAAAQNYFYSLRDYDLAPSRAVAPGPGALGGARVLSSASAWVDATDGPTPSLPPHAPGWRIRLARGESVSGEAQTFGGEVFFTTTSPTPAAAGSAAPACGASSPQRALYVLDARTGGLPGHRAARRMVLPSGERATRVAFAFPAGTQRRPAAVCFVGLTSCGSLPALSPQLTVWAELGGPP